MEEYRIKELVGTQEYLIQKSFKNDNIFLIFEYRPIKRDWMRN